jgi:serine/threonine protein kinase
MIGRVIGQYQITAKLGEGGMGVVYRATDLALRRDVALKFIRDQIGAEADAHARFMAEARAAAALNHPSICTVYQVLEAESDDRPPGRVPVLAMELVPGETLATRLEHSGPLAIDDAIRVGVEVAEGLAEAHSHGVIHRDLKPHNVMTAGGWRSARIRKVCAACGRSRPRAAALEATNCTALESEVP